MQKTDDCVWQVDDLQLSTAPPRSLSYNLDSIIYWNMTNFSAKGKGLWRNFAILLRSTRTALTSPFSCPLCPASTMHCSAIAQHFWLVQIALWIESARTCRLFICTNCSSHPKVLAFPGWRSLADTAFSKLRRLACPPGGPRPWLSSAMPGLAPPASSVMLWTQDSLV